MVSCVATASMDRKNKQVIPVLPAYTASKKTTMKYNYPADNDRVQVINTQKLNAVMQTIVDQMVEDKK